MKIAVLLLMLALLLSACGTAPTAVTIIATPPPLPTYTPPAPLPTYTPYPTYTPRAPLPTYTPFPTWTPPPRPAATATPKPGTSTRANPFPFGVPALMADGFEITVLSFDGDAWPEVKAANQFNKAPADGKIMVMMRLRVKNVSTPKEPATWLDWDVSLLGSYNSPWTGGTESSCGVIPDDLGNAELYKGGQKEGNICFQIPKDETGLLLRYQVTLFGNDFAYFATSK